MTDILICSVPQLALDRPPAAPAMLKSAAIEAGYSANTVDLSLEFFINQCDKNIQRFDELCSVFRPYEDPSNESVEAANLWVQDSIELIKKVNPKIVGISVFTFYQHRATIILARSIREQLPEIKIILGGYGLNILNNTLPASWKVSKLDSLKPFRQYMVEKKLCDCVAGDDGLTDLIVFAEKEIRNNETKIIQEKDGLLFNTPIPNYDDYRIYEYVWNDKIALPITGSKGCVRKCTFCDVPGQFGRFKQRTGTDIANEMIYLHKRYKISMFDFTDSLVNGSAKAFSEWLTVIAEYNDLQESSNGEKIYWFGQYICKPQSSVPSGTYSLMKRAGAANLVIGVESGSDAVLEAMNKKVKIKDVHDELAMFEQHNIKTHFLMLSGFYNETWERFLETLEFIVHLQKYVANGVIDKLSFGTPLYINNKMPLYDSAEELGIIIDPYNDLNWKLVDDPTNDCVERVKRRLIVQLLIDKLGIAISNNSVTNLKQCLALVKGVETKLLNQNNE